MTDPMKAMDAPLKEMKGAMKAMNGAMKAMSPNKKTIAKDKAPKFKEKKREESLFMGGDITPSQFKNMSVNEIKKLNPEMTIQRIRKIKNKL